MYNYNKGMTAMTIKMNEKRFYIVFSSSAKNLMHKSKSFFKDMLGI